MRSHIFLSLQIVASQHHYSEFRLFFDGCDQRDGGLPVCTSHLQQWLPESPQRPDAHVDIVHTGQIMQNALVDANTPCRESCAVVDLQQPPTAQWAHGAKGTPMRILQAGQCQAERDMAPLRMAMCRTAKP